MAASIIEVLNPEGTGGLDTGAFHSIQRYFKNKEKLQALSGFRRGAERQTSYGNSHHHRQHLWISTPQEAQRLHIDVLPLKLIFDGQEYADGTGMGRQFYDRLRQAKSLPTTSQVNPEAFLSLFQTYRAQGMRLWSLTLSSQISGTYQSQVIAAKWLGRGIFLVDSHSATFGMALLLSPRWRGCRTRALPPERSPQSGGTQRPDEIFLPWWTPSNS